MGACESACNKESRGGHSDHPSTQLPGVTIADDTFEISALAATSSPPASAAAPPATAPSAADPQTDADAWADALPAPMKGPLPGDQEVRICPMSGLSTLHGICPMAKKPKSQIENGEKEEKKQLRLSLDIEADDGTTTVSISVRPRLREYFETLNLEFKASKEEIRKRHRVLALQHHPDKQPQAEKEEAAARYTVIREAFDAIKETDGELAFAKWDEFPESRQTANGEEAVRMFGMMGAEACKEYFFKAIQLRHLAKSATTVQSILREVPGCGEDGEPCLECHLEAVTVDESTGAEHLVTIKRRTRGPPQETHDMTTDTSTAAPDDDE